ncbi:MAG: F0F1 ATP synthase subunit A [Candidatus Peribacteria bacterium]|nr:F0F1 ATP synthase subunit A [Candidatus Peribacteria bacterium]
MEKFVNVFVGWLHFISEFIKILSLALRLFGNIFA